MAKTAQAVIETKVKDGASAGFRKVDKAMKNTAKQGKVLNQQFRFMRGGLGQVGHQVQDVAVQLQMGQNAMLVFGQQGSQIASLFGPGGAMLGAVLAVGAALSMALLPRLFGATEAAKSLKREMKDLATNFDKLTEAQKALVRANVKKQIEDNNYLIKQQQRELADLTSITLSFNRILSMDTAEEEAARKRVLSAEIDTLKQANIDLGKSIDHTTDIFEKENAALEKQINTYGMSTNEIKKYELQQAVLRGELELTEELHLLSHIAQLDRLAEAAAAREADIAAKQEEAAQEEMRLGQKDRLINALDLEIAKAQGVTQSNLEARISVADLTEEERGLIQAKMDKLQLLDQEKAKMAKLAAWEKKSATEKGAHLAGEAAKSFGAFAHNSKKAARLQKTVQVAQAVMNTITGATAALDDYPVPINFAMAAMTVAQGMGMVSQIKSQSFDGGGFTGNGTRQGGVDGKGGFNAILHPNETVIDHTKGQSMGGVVVNQSFNISTGVEQTVRAEIQNLMPQITNITKNAVAEAKMRGGAYSKQLIGA